MELTRGQVEQAITDAASGRLWMVARDKILAHDQAQRQKLDLAEADNDRLAELVQDHKQEWQQLEEKVAALQATIQRLEGERDQEHKHFQAAWDEALKYKQRLATVEAALMMMCGNDLVAFRETIDAMERNGRAFYRPAIPLRVCKQAHQALAPAPVGHSGDTNKMVEGCDGTK